MSVLKRTLTKWGESFSPDNKKFSIATRKIIADYSYCEAEKIGSGYSSCVYKGRSEVTGEIVAIKVIDVKVLRKDQLHLSLLHSEIETLKSMTNQPNILHLHNTYTTQNHVYIITQCCESDLARILKTKKKFPLIEAMDIISQVMNGYLYLSQKGFIHRDLKPANILYDSGFYMIGDFGFAVLASTIKSTKNQYNVGSPLYMAPEALQDNKYNFCTDMWSIGIIFYEMITGQAPWYASDQKELYHKIVTKPITKMLDNVPLECRDFLKGVLNFKSQERLTPTEVLEWLNYFVQYVQKQPILKKNIHSEMPKVDDLLVTPKLEQKQERPVSARSNKTKDNPRGRSPLRLRINTAAGRKGEHINQPNTPTIINQPVEFKIRILLYYCKFIHRILLILTSPLKYQFPTSETLQRYLVDVLIFKIQRLNNLTPQNNWCNFVKLEEYIKSPNVELQRAVQKAYHKYREMYQEGSTQPSIELGTIQKSIYELKKHLECEFDDKSILLMDYLTTLYQLFRMEQKYETSQFCTLSTLDTIMERNPTGISEDHLEKLINKIIILGI